MRAGDKVRCVEKVDDLVEGEVYDVTEVVAGRLRVSHPLIRTSSLLTHLKDRFALEASRVDLVAVRPW